MIKNKPKTTLYLNDSVKKALQRRVVDTDQTMSDYVNRAVAYAIAEDLEDLEAIEARRNQPTETLEEFTKALKADGVI